MPTPVTSASLVESDERRALCESVGGIARSFGPDYFQQQVDDSGNAQELWRANREKGFLGVHLPDEHGGGGLGLEGMAIVVEQTAVSGVPSLAMLFSPGVTGTILDRSATSGDRS